jgi:hypothetical protein
MNGNIFQVLELAEIAGEEAIHHQQWRRQQRRLVLERRMIDPMASISDREFRRHFRFDKERVGRLADIIQNHLEFESDRGTPLTPIQQLCVALNFYGGGHFQRIAGLCGGVSQPTAHRCIKKVTEAICLLKPEYIMMPTRQQMQDTARKMEDKFDLPRFAYGVDGVVVKFASKPRGIPDGNVGQNYWNRKNCYAINCQEGVYISVIRKKFLAV